MIPRFLRFVPDACSMTFTACAQATLGKAHREFLDVELQRVRRPSVIACAVWCWKTRF